MSDTRGIAKELRQIPFPEHDGDLFEAAADEMDRMADEIERLRAELEELKRVPRRRIADWAPPRFGGEPRGDNQ